MNKGVYVLNSVFPLKKGNRDNKLPGEGAKTESPVPKTIDPVVTKVELEQRALSLEFKVGIREGVRAWFVNTDVI